ncbi:sulfite exporter TauE/SafE family protein [Acuticoccus sp. I52.16.1]|uniref:sulfite exporter TauE/SafE family protein n=1 Tax=Acuticoccus sp. I52.16.1 TaxID=2928472 RepID=UPI001FD17F0A|nr:sulfite exporter TauE/SafE family protein [Acuticoccus sp. I52.16.1]UOM33288.1 sulfite exporter TauE/SafE family protein [Acuticoccus sp. I52.16.1]
MTIFLVLSTIFVGSVMKGAIGIGLPLLATPVLSIYLGVPAAVAIVSIPIVATNARQVVKFRADVFRQRYLAAFLVAGGVGVVLGTTVLVSAPVALLQIGLGGAVLAYLAIQLLMPPLVITPAQSRVLGGPVGLLTGLLQGAVGISSVVSITFLQALRLERAAFVGSISSMFLMFSTIQIAALVVEGTMTREYAALGALSLLAAGAGMWLGDKFASRMTATLFRRVVFAMLGLLSAMLVIGGVAAL